MIKYITLMPDHTELVPANEICISRIRQQGYHLALLKVKNDVAAPLTPREIGIVDKTSSVLETLPTTIFYIQTVEIIKM